MKRKLFYLILCLSVLGIAIGIALAAYLFQWNPFNPLQRSTVNVDQIDREFYYHIPDNIAAHPKLIFVLHGSKTTGKLMQLVTGHQFDKLADESKDVIIVYPNAYQKYWNDCRKDGNYESKRLKLNDVQFFVEMVAYFSGKYHIDSTAIFVTGLSGGGQMCYKLAKEKPELFKGFAAISANLPVETNNACFEKSQPVSMLVMNGTADPINPYNGGEVQLGPNEKRGMVMATDETVQYWMDLAHCDTLAGTVYNFPDVDTSDHSTAVKYNYRCDSTGKEVVLIKIINGGHMVPNPGFSLWPTSRLGNVNKDINAPKIIFDYFMGLK